MKYLVLDIGGTFMKIAILNEDAVLMSQQKIKTPLDTLSHFFTIMDDLVSNDITGIALSFPGVVDAKQGLIIEGGSLQYMSGVSLTSLITKRYHKPCTVENDARCAALAEVWKGNLQGIEIGMVAIFGTGIGTSLVYHGSLFKGAHSFAGEVSCMLSDAFEEKGWKASFAHTAGIPFLLDRISKAKGMNPALTGELLFQLLEDHDAVATSLFHEYCVAMAKAFYNMQCMIDPQRVCIGGGVSKQPIFINSIKQAMDDLYKKLPIHVPMPELVECKFHNDSNLIGALYHYISKMST